MTNTYKWAQALVGAAFLAGALSAPAKANDRFEEAHSLRSLDIMLMVTSLRCRGGPHDFQSDYHQFSAAQMPHLTAASRTLKRTFEASYGEQNPARALDRMGVKIANAYGGGHPWMNCAQLGKAVRDLSQSADATSLVTHARTLLSASRPQTTQTQIAQSAPRDNVQITYNMTVAWEKRP